MPEGLTPEHRTPGERWGRVLSRVHRPLDPSPAPVPRVTIGILTYRRAQGLRLLLEHLARLDYPAEALRVLVVDNDPEGSALDLVRGVAARSSFSLEACPSPENNLSVGRNLLLSKAERGLFAFMDDDQWPDPAWLSHLVGVWLATGADAVFGPVVPVPDPEVGHRLVRRMFRRPSLPDRAVMADGRGTGNVLLDLASPAFSGLRFDPRFGRTGGEDSEFFFRAQTRGAHYVWAAQAQAMEAVPAHRLTWRFILRRAWRSGQVYARIRARHGESGLRLILRGWGAALGHGALLAFRDAYRVEARFQRLNRMVGGLGQACHWLLASVGNYGERG